MIYLSSHGPVTHKQNVSIQITLSVNLNKIKTKQNTWGLLEMACKRCVGHTINVPGASPTSLISDVGIDTSTSTCLTSSTTTRQKSSPSWTI